MHVSMNCNTRRYLLHSKFAAHAGSIVRTESAIDHIERLIERGSVLVHAAWSFAYKTREKTGHGGLLRV